MYTQPSLRRLLYASAIISLIALAGCKRETPPVATPTTTQAKSPTTQTTPATTSSLVPLQLELPKPLFSETPKQLKDVTVDFTLVGKPRPPLMVPADVKLLSLKKPVKLSDDAPGIGDAAMVTDGNKEGTEFLETGPGVQWAQVDLGQPAVIYAIAIWHNHASIRVYRDVVVQIADDPDFIENVRTLFNNDQDNSAGQGVGTDREYIEGYEGKLIGVKQHKARYVRCFTKGSTSDESNHLIEIEVWGTSTK